MAEISASKK